MPGIVQKQARLIIQEEVPAIVDKQTRQIIQEEVPRIVETQARKIMKEELKPIKQDIAEIRGDIKAIISFFDREYIALRRRVERIEEHLQLAPIPS
ncbi:MAG: hypothetical protein A2Y38_05700 [Spirochaetes bacterium GWB1_59_5]|nr:MAG: hypothetical protein A2Y38_05700 [Spirochaetes bacterium GWB1_59_5]